jgi:bifunctional UDP-N-acetylglucosamine pyrophosphorylase/glucosamine-1-phosphate N-acetyltransferase
MEGITAIILAAGQGKRMKSEIPKVLHRAAGTPLIQYVIDSVVSAAIDELIIVTGQGSEQVRQALGADYSYALQTEPRGTGDAVKRALPNLSAGCLEVLVCCGDTPLLTGATLSTLIETRRQSGAEAVVLSSVFDNPAGYGRICRGSDNMVEAIVEDKDATQEQKEICEINTGTYIFTREALEKTINRLTPDNKQGEYYLTDCIALLRGDGMPVAAVTAPPEETVGINTRRELAAAEHTLRQRQCDRLMDAGVTIIDPASTFIDRQVEVGPDTVIYPFTLLEGSTRVGRRCLLGPGTRLVSATLGEDVTVQSSVIMESEVGNSCNIGPFAYIRPGSVLADQVKIGDFVELKKTVVGHGSKIPHLSYVGDSLIGSGVNVGAGTITCNYDGVHKHQTIIEDGAFIGSNTNLVAPVTVGQGAVTGAGSTITRDVPAHALAVERARQTVIAEWVLKKGEKGK